MIHTQLAINRLRRDLAVGVVVRMALLVAALGAIAFETLPFKGSLINGTTLLVGVGAVWIFLGLLSMKSSRLVAMSPMLIGAGELDKAEQYIEQSLRGFSLIRSLKLRSLHNLAMLRHAQKRHAEAALLCRELLKQKLGALSSLARSANLILANSSLEVGDLPTAWGALAALYRHRLPLSEALQLNAIQTEYLARIGAWDQIVLNIAQKVQMAELLPTEQAATTQRHLAEAARRMGQMDWHLWLSRRVALLTRTAPST